MNENMNDLIKGKDTIYTEQQQAAILHDNGSALVLSVPGSGKTTVIIERIGNLIRTKKARADNILAITFSKASAIDMTKRFRDRFKDENLGAVSFSTIHSFSNWIVTNYNRRFGIKSKLITTREALSAIKSSYTASTGKYLTEDSLETYTTAISFIKNRMLNEEEIAEYAKVASIQGLVDVLDGYENFKKQNDLYDYDDMILNAIHILKNNSTTLEFLRNKYKYICVDEAQDTSALQYELIRMVVNEQNNIYLVADDDQSIYLFRGAYSELLLNINDIFPGTKLYFMEQNFRSDKNIVNVANTLIVNNKKRYKKKIATSKENGELVKIVHTKDASAQTKHIMDNLSERYGSTVILYRNNISVIPVAHELKKKGIDFYAGSYKPGFFNHWVTFDALAIVNLIIDESDIDSFSKIYYKIETYLTKKIIKDTITKKGTFNSVFDYITDNCDIPSKQKSNIRRIQTAFKRARGMVPHKGLNYLITHLGYTDHLEKNSLENDSSVSSLIQIIETIVEIAKGASTYEEIKNEMKALNEALNNSRNNTEASLCLSTLHSSKGLEFDNVFIINVDKGILPAPTNERLDKEAKEEELEEARRLFYVGVTRAKKRLTILSVGMPSKFIDEINKEEDSIKIIK